MRRLLDMKPSVEDKGEFLREIAMGFEKGEIFLTALELDIFTKLKELKTAEALSMEMGTHHELMRRFLDILVALGVLAKHKNQYLTAPSVVPFLVEGEPYNLNLKHYWEHIAEARDNWLNFKKILNTGPLNKLDIYSSAIHEHKFDSDMIGWIARWTMLGRLQATLKIISKLPEFKNARRLIDSGGGHGLFAIGFAQKNPKLEAIVFDQPEVTEITQEYIARYETQDRVRTMAGDFTKDDLGSGYDIAFESLAHYEPKERIIAFYRRVHAVLNDSGFLITQ
jgi:predicted O-methyltransferase YrrM